MENNTSKEGNTTVNFVAPSGADYSTYTFEVLPPEVNITVANDIRVIEAFVGNNGQPVEGENVLVDFTSDTQGRMSSFSGITDADGHVAFNYTAEEDISGLIGSSISVVLRMENNTSKEGNTTVNFVDTLIDTTDYNLYAIPTEINVSAT